MTTLRPSLSTRPPRAALTLARRDNQEWASKSEMRGPPRPARPSRQASLRADLSSPPVLLPFRPSPLALSPLASRCSAPPFARSPPPPRPRLSSVPVPSFAGSARSAGRPIQAAAAASLRRARPRADAPSLALTLPARRSRSSFSRCRASTPPRPSLAPSRSRSRPLSRLRPTFRPSTSSSRPTTRASFSSVRL
jgi:hypothetical protein